MAASQPRRGRHRYATGQGVVTVASAGNSQYDLQHKFIDDSSPNDGASPVETRVITNACLDLPAEAPGVITVSATGPTGIKSFYSNYGLGVVDIAAPGGDSRLPGSEPNGRVFSTTWPGSGWGTSRARRWRLRTSAVSRP